MMQRHQSSHFTTKTRSERDDHGLASMWTFALLCVVSWGLCYHEGSNQYEASSGGGVMGDGGGGGEHIFMWVTSPLSSMMGCAAQP